MALRFNFFKMCEAAQCPSLFLRLPGPYICKPGNLPTWRLTCSLNPQNLDSSPSTVGFEPVEVKASRSPKPCRKRDGFAPLIPHGISETSVSGMSISVTELQAVSM